MKTRISFWLNHHTTLLAIYDAQYNPFKVGDKIYFSVAELHPRTIDELKKQFKEEFVKSVVDSNAEERKKYHIFRFKIKSVNISIEKNDNYKDEDCITTDIEYMCKESPKFYFEWWYFKGLLKSLFNIK